MIETLDLFRLFLALFTACCMLVALVFVLRAHRDSGRIIDILNRQRINADDPLLDPTPCACCFHGRLQHVHEPPGTLLRFVDGLCSVQGCECTEYKAPRKPYTPPEMTLIPRQAPMSIELDPELEEQIRDQQETELGEALTRLADAVDEEFSADPLADVSLRIEGEPDHDIEPAAIRTRDQLTDAELESRTGSPRIRHEPNERGNEST